MSELRIVDEVSAGSFSPLTLQSSHSEIALGNHAGNHAGKSVWERFVHLIDSLPIPATAVFLTLKSHASESHALRSFSSHETDGMKSAEFCADPDFIPDPDFITDDHVNATRKP